VVGTQKHERDGGFLPQERFQVGSGRLGLRPCNSRRCQGECDEALDKDFFHRFRFGFWNETKVQRRQALCEKYRGKELNQFAAYLDIRGMGRGYRIIFDDPKSSNPKPPNPQSTLSEKYRPSPQKK
jgi:hypothetical protein